MTEMDKILIRFGEISLKSRSVRRKFLERLVFNIRSGLDNEKIEYKIEKEWSRIFVETKEMEKTFEVLRHVFGIVSFSPVIVVSSEMEKMVKAVEKLGKQIISKNETFAIRASRTGNHDFTSKDVEKTAGAAVQKITKAKVDLENPDKTIYLEVRDKKCYIFTEKINGPGGLPLGTQGKVVALFSGGMDSAVAAWFIMRRGCKIIPVYADCSPYTDKSTLQRAKKVLKALEKWSAGSKLNLRIVEHGKNLFLFQEEARKDLTCLLCKRMMYRIAGEIAQKNDADAVLTGENLGQVASQTLQNLKVLNEAVKLPVLRPLIGMDKNEIMEKAREIGTYEASIQKAKECSAVSKKPRTRATLEEVKKEESKFDIEKLVKQSIKK